MAILTWNNRGQIIINGQPRFLTAIYDGDTNGNDMADLVGPTKRNYARYRFTIVNNVQSGSVGNGLRLADAPAPLNMYCFAVGNLLTNFTWDPTYFNLATLGNSGIAFDVNANPTYTTSPEGTGPFRTLWPQKTGAIGVYLADEPATNAVGWTNGTAINQSGGANYLLNPTFSTLTSWTTTVNGGGSGTVTIVSSRAQLSGGTSTSVDLSQATTIAALTVGQPYKFWFTLYSATALRVRLTSGAATLIDETLTGAAPPPGTPYWRVFTPAAGQTSVTAIFSVATGVTGTIDNVGITAADVADPPPVPSLRARDNIEQLYAYYRANMTPMMQFDAYINDNPYQWLSWSPEAIGDMVGN